MDAFGVLIGVLIFLFVISLLALFIAMFWEWDQDLRRQEDDIRRRRESQVIIMRTPRMSEVIDTEAAGRVR